MKIGLMEIKKALLDGRFREKLPIELKDKMAKYLHCPSCSTSTEILREILKNCQNQLLEYFPGAQIDEQQELKKLSENHFSVINCNVKELESKLKSLPPGRKTLAISRYQDEITVVINEVNIF
jgi:uncharacterized Zn finger protein